MLGHHPPQAIEAFDHPVCLQAAKFGQPVFNAERVAQQIEPVLATRVAQLVEQPVGKHAAVICEERPCASRSRWQKRNSAEMSHQISSANL